MNPILKTLLDAVARYLEAHPEEVERIVLDAINHPPTPAAK